MCFLVLLGFQHVILSCAGALIDVANMMRRRYDELNCVMKHTRTQETASSPSGPRCSQTLTASPRPTNRESCAPRLPCDDAEGEQRKLQGADASECA